MTACDKFQQVPELLTQILPSDSADWANAVVGGADRKLTFVTLTYHGSGPIYGTPRHPPWYFDPGSPTRVPKKQPFRGSPRLKTVSSAGFMGPSRRVTSNEYIFIISSMKSSTSYRKIDMEIKCQL